MTQKDTEEQKKQYYENWLMEQLHKLYRTAYEMKYDKKGYGFGEFQEEIVEMLSRDQNEKPISSLQTKPAPEPKLADPIKDDMALAGSNIDYYKSAGIIAKWKVQQAIKKEQAAMLKQNESIRPVNEESSLAKGFIDAARDVKLSVIVIVGAITLGWISVGAGNIPALVSVVVGFAYLSPSIVRELSNGKYFGDEEEKIIKPHIQNQIEKPAEVKAKIIPIEPQTFTLSGAEVIAYAQTHGLSSQQFLDYQAKGSIIIDKSFKVPTNLIQEGLNDNNDQITVDAETEGLFNELKQNSEILKSMPKNGIGTKIKKTFGIEENNAG